MDEAAKAIETTEWDADLAALVPQPITTFRLAKRDAQGRVVRGARGEPVWEGEWPVWSFMDLPYDVSLQVLAIQDEVQGQTAAGYIERSRKQIRLICPEMPEAVVAKLSPRQMLTLAAQAQRAERAAGNPPGPGGAPVSSSLSPAPGASSDGVTGS